MYLTRHRCADFRNIGSLSLEPSRGVNVICGENGHGKTNLLESLFLLTGARSFRMAKDIALIKNGAAAARISSGFFSEGRAQTLELTIDEKGRSSSLNSGSAVKASAAAGAVRCVIFCPENLELVKGSPEKRRRWSKKSSASQITNRSYGFPGRTSGRWMSALLVSRMSPGRSL